MSEEPASDSLKPRITPGVLAIQESIAAVAAQVGKGEGSAQGRGLRKTEKADPQKAARALEMLAEGATLKKVYKTTGLRFPAIVRLKVDHEKALDIRRKELAMEGFELVEMARLLQRQKMERMADDPELLDKTPLKDIAITYAIHQDKAFQALGETNRLIVEHRRGPSIEDAMAAIAAAREEIKVEAIEVETETDDGEKEES